MPVNLTIDDSSQDLDYSSGWTTQGNDPGSANFFDLTYHAAAVNRSTVNFTFTGNGVFAKGVKALLDYFH